MVYYGVSRGCATCKQRRKKCDEARPACKRCIKANRTCLGYKDESDLIFRPQHYGPGEARIDPPTADCCEQKINFASPVGRVGDSPDVQLEQTARTSFLQDYCIVSSDLSLSRGYLDGLEQLVDHYGPSSDLALALTVVSLGSYGRRRGRPNVLGKAEERYYQMLRSFRSKIASVDPSNVVESLVIAVLLGLYEIITATELRTGAHQAHREGVSAILALNDSPFDIHRAAQLFQLGNPLPFNLSQPENARSFGILRAPSETKSLQSLDSILVRSRPVQARLQDLADSPTAIPHTPEIDKLKEDAMLIALEYAQWPTDQPEEWVPKTVGFIHQSAEELKGTIYRPGKVESYFDQFVAGVWNSYRKCRLLFLDRLIKALVRLQTDHNINERPLLDQLNAEVRGLETDIAASVPYQLTDFNEKSSHQPWTKGSTPALPGRPASGLLLFHPLYVGSVLSVVSPEMQDYFRVCLTWIGQHMGIGQAALLAEHREVMPYNFVRDGHLLVWAGMLVRRLPEASS